MLKAILAAGCFWGVESIFTKVPGVIATRVGYTGGQIANPSYEQVCRGDTGHAEAIEITFNPAQVTYAELLDSRWREIESCYFLHFSGLITNNLSQVKT